MMASQPGERQMSDKSFGTVVKLNSFVIWTKLHGWCAGICKYSYISLSFYHLRKECELISLNIPFRHRSGFCLGKSSNLNILACMRKRRTEHPPLQSEETWVCLRWGSHPWSSDIGLIKCHMGLILSCMCWIDLSHLTTATTQFWQKPGQSLAVLYSVGL